VLAEEVVDQHGHAWRTTWPTPMPEGQWTPTLHRGRLLTVDELTATPADKQQLAERHQACAVEMESAAFAVRCAAAGVPFGCVRAISDEAATMLSPALVSLLSGGISMARPLGPGTLARYVARIAAAGTRHEESLRTTRARSR
jgi:adenosylhomocysteine nucleosidase